MLPPIQPFSRCTLTGISYAYKSPDEDKSLADSKALVPALKDFFRKHPLINPKTFLGDAAFDSIETYKYLLQEASFGQAYIPLNSRISLPESDCPLN